MKKIDAFLHEINGLLSAIPETSGSDIGPRGLEEAARPLCGAGSADDRASSPWEPPLGTEKILPCFMLEGVLKFWLWVPASSGQRCVGGGVLFCAHLLLVMLKAFISPACP